MIGPFCPGLRRWSTAPDGNQAGSSDPERKNSLSDAPTGGRPEPISLLLLDIDYFKRFNDRYGHNEGDSCLQQVAQTLKEVARRPTDLAARYGGEEFAVILPGTPLGGARKVAEAFQTNLAAAAIPHEDSYAGPIVTASIGIATMKPSPSDNSDSLVKAADDLLYKAKDAGRNQIAAAHLQA